MQYNNKAVKYGFNGTLIGFSIRSLLNANSQLKRLALDPQSKFDFQDIFQEGMKGGIAGGITGCIIGSVVDYNNAKIIPVDTNRELIALVEKNKLHTTDWQYINLCKRADVVTDLLRGQFSSKLKGRPIRIGSTEENTALRANFDIDLFCAFKAASFGSTKEMYESVLAFCKQLRGRHGIVDIRDQKKSVGVAFIVGGKTCWVDVVPCKLSNRYGNKTSGYLSVNNKSIWVNKSSYTKTDVRLLTSQKIWETQKNIVILLKQMKLNKNLPVSSHLLKNLVFDAYKYNGGRIPFHFTDKVIMVLKHIKDHLNIARIRSVENSNNILTNISSSDKILVIEACKEMIEDYNYQRNSIAENFK